MFRRLLAIGAAVLASTSQRADRRVLAIVCCCVFVKQSEEDEVMHSDDDGGHGRYAARGRYMEQHVTALLLQSDCVRRTLHGQYRPNKYDADVPILRKEKKEKNEL